MAQTTPAVSATAAADDPTVRFVSERSRAGAARRSAEVPEVDFDAQSALPRCANWSSMSIHGELSSEMMLPCQAVYFESRGEPLDGQLAVARVIINRAESSPLPR